MEELPTIPTQYPSNSALKHLYDEMKHKQEAASKADERLSIMEERAQQAFSHPNLGNKGALNKKFQSSNWLEGGGANTLANQRTTVQQLEKDARIANSKFVSNNQKYLDFLLYSQEPDLSVQERNVRYERAKNFLWGLDSNRYN